MIGGWMGAWSSKTVYCVCAAPLCSSSPRVCLSADLLPLSEFTMLSPFVPRLQKSFLTQVSGFGLGSLEEAQWTVPLP